MSEKNFYGSDNWQDKISNPKQIGGIETSVLDNGAERGVRIAWFNTGAGLRFKLVLDRAMDIADAFYGQHCFSWMSNIGVCPPAPALHGMDWLTRFGGGLMTTCGLSHIGGPDDNNGLHGRISNTPAEIVSIVQPDPRAGKYEMSIEGRILESTVFGPHLELRRKISVRLGENKIFVRDTIRNIGNTPAPHMLLYHVNLSWPLIDENSKLLWKGKAVPSNPNDEFFADGADCKTCKAPSPNHDGANESVAFIDIEADADGLCSCEALNERLNFGVKINFSKKQLPWLINWQHWGKNEYVTALEPATNPPIGQKKAREEGSLIVLKPNEERTYELSFEIV